MNQIEFMSHIIAEICDYAVKNNLKTDDLLQSFADHILCMLDIVTLNDWSLKEDAE